MVAIRDAIVGRDAELAAIDEFLAGEAGGTLLIEGEPGIGKTTLWSAAVAAAEEHGYRVLRAQPAESETKLSYAALADLVGEAYDEIGAELPDPQRRALDAALLRADGPAGPRTSGTALVSVLEALGARSPVLLALDDVQWLDRASAGVLEFAVRRLPDGVRLLLAQRPRPEPKPTTEPLTHVAAGPLSLAALQHLLRERLDRPLPRPLLVRIAETSGGNPFFALEIARALDDGHDLGSPLPVPPSLHDLVADRIGALSPGAREAALVAAALSRPTVATVGATSAALDEAESAGVLVVDRGRIRFSHPLLASAVYGAAGGTQRLELHRRLADLVDDPDERALHLALCATPPDGDTAIELEEAARRVGRRGAQDAAGDLYRAASRLTPAADVAGISRRLLGEATALHATGSPHDARALAEQAVKVAPSGPHRAEAYFELSRIAWVAGGELGPLDCLRLALDEGGDDRRLRGRIHAKLGMYSDSDQPRGFEHSKIAASLLDEDDDPGLFAYTLLALLFFGAQTGHGVDESLLEHALELEQRAGPESEKSSLVLIWYQCTDAHEAARERHALEDAWYRDRGDEIWRAEKRAHLALVEFRAGNWALARDLVERSCSELEPVGSEGPLGMPLWTRARFDASSGAIERARATLLPMLEVARKRSGSAWFATFLLETLGFAALTEGDFAAADAAFTEQESLLETIGVTVPLAVRTDADQIEAVLGLGDLERAQRLLARFEQRNASAPRPWTRLTLPRAQALVSAAAGDVDASLALLDRAPAYDELPFDHARNLLVRGLLERRLRRKRAAAESLRSAGGIFGRLGSPEWARRARRSSAVSGSGAATPTS